MEGATMSHSDQRSVHAAPEKIVAQQTRRDALAVGGAIRDCLCITVAGMSLRDAMT